jgi:hypothetical protein
MDVFDGVGDGWFLVELGIGRLLRGLEMVGSKRCCLDLK